MEENLQQTTENLIDESSYWIDYIWEQIPMVLGFIALLFITWICSRWAKRLVVSATKKANLDISLQRFLGNLAKWLVLVTGFGIALGNFGIDTASIAAVLASAGIAVGLALQGTLSNFAAGVMLLIFRPFKVHDLVQIDGKLGTVEEIDLFSTALNTLDNRRIIIPNANIFGNTIENFTFNPVRRVDINIGTEYGADLDAARKALEKAAISVEGRVEQPPYQVIVLEFGDSSINWQVRVWCNTDDYWLVWERTIHAIYRELADANLGIPFPQMDVHIDGKLDA